jgi:hypothetical protein
MKWNARLDWVALNGRDDRVQTLRVLTAMVLAIYRAWLIT